MAAIVEELHRAGVTGDALVAAIARLEAAAIPDEDDADPDPAPTPRQARNRRYYVGHRRPRLKASEIKTIKTDSDGFKTLSDADKERSPTPPKEIIPLSSLRSERAPSGAPADLEKQFYDRSRQIIGKAGGGMAKLLLKSQAGSIEKARAALEVAATKSDPREYIGAIIRGRERDEGRPDPRL